MLSPRDFFVSLSTQAQGRIICNRIPTNYILIFHRIPRILLPHNYMSYAVLIETAMSLQMLLVPIRYLKLSGGTFVINSIMGQLPNVHEFESHYMNCYGKLVTTWPGLNPRVSANQGV